MFLEFFYLLRGRGLPVSPKEWLTLTEALNSGVCSASLVDFYYTARAILCRSEQDFDKFDCAFLEFFKDVKPVEELPQELLDWLARPREDTHPDMDTARQNAFLSPEEIRRRFEERLAEQHERHDGGNYWIGTGGASTMGHHGYSAQGIRVGGEGWRRSAIQLAGEHHYADFREDRILDLRQFQMAFRKLRQFSAQADTSEQVLDLDASIRETCQQAGRLKLVFGKPRKNTVKLLLLFDSGGSMYPYSTLCNSLFQAARRSNHFADLKVFYFHNCVYDHLYTTPNCQWREWVETEQVMRTLSRDYLCILVGDACMAPSELLYEAGTYYYGMGQSGRGIDCLHTLHSHYPRAVWLNPIPQRSWEKTYGSATISMVRKEFPMFELSLEGLQQALRRLLTQT